MRQEAWGYGEYVEYIDDDGAQREGYIIEDLSVQLLIREPTGRESFVFKKDPTLKRQGD